MGTKILLVGNPRICWQVAYVMDWTDYEQVAQLTDAAPYCDYQIVVCAFKNKSKRLVRVKDKTLNIIYLDDISHELDKDETTVFVKPEKIDVPLWRRALDRLHTGETVITFLRRYRRRHGSLRSKFWINRLPLAQLTTAELLVKVLYSRPTNINCNRLLNYCSLGHDGNLNGCCVSWVLPFGNIIGTGLPEVFNSPRARIIKLSALNRSYCFCDLQRCECIRRQTNAKLNPSLIGHESTKLLPVCFELAIDVSCNLRCPSCRRDYCAPTAETKQRVEQIMDRVKASGWLTAVPQLIMQGAGEIFCSQTLWPMLSAGMSRQQVHLLSNGLLFDRAHWEALKKHYNQIDVEISVDAVTAATYAQIRGGDFQQLSQNLAMLGELRAQGEIRYFELNFVVQQANYLEMADFVRWAKKLNADRVHFTHLNNWGTYTDREYQRQCLIIHNRRLDPKLARVLQDPIFQEPIVDLLAFSRYIKNFAQKFPHSLEPKSPYAW